MLKDIAHRHLYYAALHGLVWSILFSKAGVSISIVILVLLSIFRVQSISPVRVYINKAFFSAKTYRESNKYYLCIVGLFLLTGLSYFNSENTAEWFHFIKLKTPLLLLPIVFINHRTLDKQVYHQLYLSLIAAISISSIWVLVNYFVDWTAITDSMGYGKSIETPLSHVKYSVLMALACMACAILSQVKRFNKWFLLALAAYLFICLHVLAVRSGLVVLYLVGGFLLLYYYWVTGRKSMIVCVLIAALLVPIVAYHTIPSVYHKVHYVKHDLKMIQQGNTANYSDGERIRSLQIGWDMIKKNPVLGTGIGDVRDIVNDYYAEWYPDSSKKILPHNQYILVWASYGIVGLLIFLGCILGLLYRRSIRLEPLFYCLILTVLIYGLVEKPLDEYVFVAVFALFSCAGISSSQPMANKSKSPWLKIKMKNE